MSYWVIVRMCLRVVCPTSFFLGHAIPTGHRHPARYGGEILIARLIRGDKRFLPFSLSSSMLCTAPARICLSWFFFLWSKWLPVFFLFFFRIVWKGLNGCYFFYLLLRLISIVCFESLVSRHFNPKGMAPFACFVFSYLSVLSRPFPPVFISSFILFHTSSFLGHFPLSRSYCSFSLLR